MPLPLTVEDLTLDWLAGAIQEKHPQVIIERIVGKDIIWGTATKVLLRVEYAAGSQPAALPVALCAKGGFDPKLRGLALSQAYQREAQFFHHLAPTIAIPLPLCVYSGVDTDHGQGIIILENLTESGAVFGEPTEAWPVDRVAAALEVLATLHGATWGGDTHRYPWIDSVSPVRQVAEVMLGAPYWDQHFASPEAPQIPAMFQDQELMARAFERSWQWEDAAAHCVLHNDPHLGNTYISASGQPAFIDWQAVCFGPAIDDVAYFMGGALSIADRRSHERHLLTHYLDRLAAAGGPRLTVDDVWDDYRRFQIHGFLWATTGPMQQTPARVAAMTERHVTAMEDLDCLAALAL